MFMSDWFGLIFILLLIAGALVAAARAGAPAKRLSVEEFEERARTGAYTRAGMFGLQQLLHPKAVKTITVQQDLKAGYYNKKLVPGDGDDAAAKGEPEVSGGRESSNESEESDA